MAKEITASDREKAEICLNKCPICREGRKKQRGFRYLFIKIEEGLCPNCRAYRKVYGRKAHEPLTKKSAPK